MLIVPEKDVLEIEPEELEVWDSNRIVSEVVENIRRFNVG